MALVLHGVLLCQDAVVHDQHPVARGKQPLVMSDHDRGLSQLMGLIGEQMGDVLSPSGIQSGSRLVRQNDVGIVLERHRNGGALALAPGELGGIGVCTFRDAQ